tara:strand:+ start:414 stop:614 length:201 start_codon:yes stop_codon:yes gene_type:complete
VLIKTKENKMEFNKKEMIQRLNNKVSEIYGIIQDIEYYGEGHFPLSENEYYEQVYKIQDRIKQLEN